MKFCVILSFFLLFYELRTAFAQNCSTLNRSYKDVLSRKKRFLIFNKGGAIIHSSAFGKQLVAGFPRGFNWILEIDMFWPLPFEARVFTQAKDLLFGKNKPKINIPVWLQNQPKTPSYSTYKAFLHQRSTTPMPATTKKTVLYENFYQSPWDNHVGEIFVPNEANYYKPRGRSMKFEDNLDGNSRWNNIYARKDRQELFEIIQNGYKKTGIDSKSCLQRTICEARHFLLPKGKSLLHDVFRIIFSYPEHIDDHWAEASNIKDPKSCQKLYGASCPMSILDFFLHSGHIF